MPAIRVTTEAKLALQASARPEALWQETAKLLPSGMWEIPLMQDTFNRLMEAQ